MMSVPYNTRLQQKNQVQVVSDEIKHAIRYAKLRALSDGEDVFLMPLSQSNYDWSHGIRLMKRNNQPTDVPIFEWHWSLPALQVTWHGFLSNRSLRFTPDLHRNAVNGYFMIKNGVEPAVKLTVNRLGRVREVPFKPSMQATSAFRKDR